MDMYPTLIDRRVEWSLRRNSLAATPVHASMLSHLPLYLSRTSSLPIIPRPKFPHTFS